ncbi:MAG: hypothetical protein JSU86_18940 [Phycisphaerales bacterium]|nr:MAG: hypothetical protein JSU86_18940 [Phycisphaerales bacterium]
MLRPQPKQFWRALVALTSGGAQADDRTMFPPRTADEKQTEAVEVGRLHFLNLEPGRTSWSLEHGDSSRNGPTLKSKRAR